MYIRKNRFLRFSVEGNFFRFNGSRDTAYTTIVRQRARAGYRKQVVYPSHSSTRGAYSSLQQAATIDSSRAHRKPHDIATAPISTWMSHAPRTVPRTATRFPRRVSHDAVQRRRTPTSDRRIRMNPQSILLFYVLLCL